MAKSSTRLKTQTSAQELPNSNETSGLRQRLTKLEELAIAQGGTDAGEWKGRKLLTYFPDDWPPAVANSIPSI